MSVCARRVWIATSLAVLAVLSLASLPAKAASPHITDAEDDAYRVPETPAGQPEPRPPMPILSNDTADVLSASFERGQPAAGHDGAYRLSVVVAGEPQPGFNYLVGAQFGVDCWIIHFLTPGQTRDAIAGCGEGDNYRNVGNLTGSMVTARGNTVSATFTFRRFLLPNRLKKDPRFGPFFVLTCPARSVRSWACESEDLLDYAWSESTKYEL